MRKTMLLFIMAIAFGSSLILIGSGVLSVPAPGVPEVNEYGVNNQNLYAVDSYGGGCACCSGAGDASASGDRLVQAENLAIAYFSQKYGDGDVVVKSFDSGCHVEVTFYKDDKIVKRLAVYGDTVTEL